MIACLHGWSDADKTGAGVARALTRYGGTCGRAAGTTADLYWCQGVGQSCARHGPVTALVQGWIDNADELAMQLQVATSDPASIYAAALARWGDSADAHCIGNYCAIAELADGCLRLARSPWDAPPLYHHTGEGRTVAAPLLRALFAAGAPRALDYERIVDELAYDWRDGDEAGWYRDILQVPVGCAVTITREGRRLERWYNVDALPQVCLPRDEDYPEAANALLEEAATRALAGASNPAIALSGGLDSPLAADALLRAMPSDARLPAITFIPDPRWDGRSPAGTIGDEAPAVRRFAEFAGRIDLHVADPQQGGFDFRAREMVQAMEVFAPGLANVGMMHGVWAKARELGCDMLMTADLGNLSYSDGGNWAYVEYARNGRWGELLHLLRARPGDPRSLVRKLIALTIMPQLPRAMRHNLRALVHPARRDMTGLFTLLLADARRGQRERAHRRGSAPAWDDFTFPRSRREAARLYARLPNGLAADVHLAFEQLYGVRRRDVAAYRPLVEFCLGLPTGQFAQGGVQRRLARRMASGRMPEAQRRETRHGQHNVDWHARMTPRREELIAYAEAMRSHPWLSKIADIDRMRELLEHWPAQPDFSWEGDFPRSLGLPRIILAVQFIAFAEGRNEL